MKTARYRPLVALLWHWAAALTLLSAGAALAAEPTRIAATLVPEASVAPGGTVMLALDMKPAAGWHGYWSNPGDAGLGMTLDWSLPPGLKAGDPRYPVPQTLVIAGLTNHVYEREYAVLVPLKVPDGARPGAVLPVAVDARWLACTNQVCVPERARLSAEVRIAARPGAADPRFAAWTQTLPAPLGTAAHFALEPARIRLGVPLPAGVAMASPHFYPAEDGVVAYGKPQAFSRSGDMLVIDLARADGATAAPARIGGVLRLDAVGNGLDIVALPGAVGDAASGGAASDRPLGWLLLAALAGGLILNVMPCVFPILSLKALSLARAGESERHARAEGIAYTAGVVLACVALGVLLLALRAAGEQVGWAFQLQQPAVVAALLLLAVAVTANLLGLFEFAVPGFARAGSPQSAFATGLLAAFVATPCTGPFMAAAMGAALLLPWPAGIALFAALGLGLALPFLALAFVPPLRRLLPRPGAWMERFRRWMALPMGLTALALLWLASRLAGWDFAMLLAGLAAALVLLLAWVGLRQHSGRAAAPQLGLGLAALALVATLALPRMADAPTAVSAGIVPTQPFGETALAAARAGKRPVFAWFTADWCLTCKVNERIAIERPEVRDAFARAGVVVLRGDWTRRDPAITRYLTAHGAAGVPLYVWYPPGGEARQLPQVLTPGTLTELAAGTKD